MYSILIQSTNGKYVYYTLSNGTIYTSDDLTEVASTVTELLNTHLLNEIKVVKNCTITSSFTIEEVTA